MPKQPECLSVRLSYHETAVKRSSVYRGLQVHNYEELGLLHAEDVQQHLMCLKFNTMNGFNYISDFAFIHSFISPQVSKLDNISAIQAGTARQLMML